MPPPLPRLPRRGARAGRCRGARRRRGRSTAAALPGGPQPAEVYDLNDAARPTGNLITVVVETDGTASFELPRSENGQSVTTSTAMLIAEELDLPVEKVYVTLAPAGAGPPRAGVQPDHRRLQHHRRDVHPDPMAAAVAKGALLDAAAIELGDTG